MSSAAIILDEVTPLLARVQSAAAAKGLALVGARAVGNLVREHLYALDGSRHKSGGRHFYRQAADSVTARSASAGAAVGITQLGFAQRRFGGDIWPKKQFLTIPAAPEAYGKRAGEFPDLDFAVVLDGDRLRPALVRRASQAIAIGRRRQKDGTYSRRIVPGAVRLAGEVMFWLVRHVYQQPDPSVLPTDTALATTAVAAIKTELDHIGTGGADQR